MSQETTSERVLRVAEVCERVGLSRSYIFRLEAAGEFPPRRRLSKRAVGYLESEITEWLRSRPLADDVPPDAGANLPARGWNLKVSDR